MTVRQREAHIYCQNTVEPNKRVKHEFRATEDSVLVKPFVRSIIFFSY